MFRQDGSGEDGRVPIGGSIELAADILDRLADLARIAIAGALEHHMLEQVGDAVDQGRLVAGTDLGVEGDCGRLGARHRPAGDLQPVGEGGEFHHEPRDLGCQASLGNVSRRRRWSART